MAENNRNQGSDQTNRSGQRGTSNRGFASMDKEKQKQIASEGGRAAHASGNAHEFTPDEARAAGKKGGEVVSRDRKHMAEIGRRGGQNSHGGGRSKSTERSERTSENSEATGRDQSSGENR
jgi:general stress protein YciG